MSGGGAMGYQSPNIAEYEGDIYHGVKNAAGVNGPVSGAGMYNYGGGGGSQINYGGSTAPTPKATPAVKSSNSNRGLTGTVGAGSSPGGLGGQSAPTTGANRGHQNGTVAPSGEFMNSNFGAPLGGAAGIKVASQGYDFDPINQAIAGYQNPTKLNQTYNSSSYNPYQFNYGQLPDEYTKQAYQSGASDINRAGDNSLKRIQESVGTRRPGQLLFAGQNAQRDTNRNLARLNTDLNLNRINQNLDLGKQQQMAQAGENFNAAGFNAGEQFKGYQSRADLERANESNRMANLGALAQAGQSKIGTQQGLLGSERAYQDRVLQYLMQLYNTGSGQSAQNAQLKNQQDAQTSALLGGLASSGLGAIGPIGGLLK